MWWDVWAWKGVEEEEQQKCMHVTYVTALLERVRLPHTSKMSSLTAIDDRLYLRERRGVLARHSTVHSNPGHPSPGKELSTMCFGT